MNQLYKINPGIKEDGNKMVRIMNYVADRIDEIIKEKGLKKKDVARACDGKTPGWLNNIIKKRSKIKVADLVRLSEVLSVKVEELLPVPKCMDIERMSMIDLIRVIVRKEIEGYLKEHKSEK